MASKAAKQRYYQKNKTKILAKMRAQRASVRKDPAKWEAWHLYQRNRMLLQRYGITHSDYEILYDKQAGKCGICKSAQKGVHKRYLDVDHCHKTGKVRGLLCGSCNKSLGVLENQEWIQAAEDYLKTTGPEREKAS